MALTQGFHNAPRLYGDSTVRRPVRISGIRSGVHAGWHEWKYGWKDALTGLYIHPTRGVSEPPNPVVGFFKGCGIGIGGFVLKSTAAGIGPVAYTLKGVHREIQKRKQPINFIRRARILEGQKVVAAMGPRGMDTKRSAVEHEVAEHWNAVREEYDRAKKKEEEKEKRHSGLHIHKKTGKDSHKDKKTLDEMEEHKAKKDEEKMLKEQNRARKEDAEPRKSSNKKTGSKKRFPSPKDSARLSNEHSTRPSVDSMKFRAATATGADIVRASTDRQGTERQRFEAKRMPPRQNTEICDFAGTEAMKT